MLQDPLVLLWPSLSGDLERRAGGGPDFLGKGRPFCGVRPGGGREKWETEDEQGLLGAERGWGCLLECGGHGVLALKEASEVRKSGWVVLPGH